MSRLMKKMIGAGVAIAIGVAVLVELTGAAVEAAYIPWSGWWWPQSTKALATGEGYRGRPAPFEKLDLLLRGDTAAGAAAWEIENHDGSSSWEGHCNGWSTASILQFEPDVPGVLDGIPFRVGDKKGILSEAGYGGAARRRPS